MHSRSSIIAVVGALLLMLPVARVQAQDSHEEHHDNKGSETEAGHSHEMAMIHGGYVVMTPHHHFEVLFTANDACVYVYDSNQKPITDPKDLEVTMTLLTKEGPSQPVRLEYQAPDPDEGRTQGYFRVARDMDMKDGEAKAIFGVAGLQDEPIEFRTAVVMGDRAVYACPMGDSDPAEDPGKCPKCGMQMKMMSHGESMGEHMDEHMQPGEHGRDSDTHDGHHR